MARSPRRREDARRAAGLLRGVLDRVGSLEQAISSTDAIPNLVRRVDETGEATDTVSRTVAAVDYLTWDDATESWDGQQWG